MYSSIYDSYQMVNKAWIMFKIGWSITQQDRIDSTYNIYMVGSRSIIYSNNFKSDI